jgi:hypothetical protein
MALRSQSLRARVYVQACVISCVLSAPCVSQAPEVRPSLSAACVAWHEHIADLIDQHRIASELDSEQLSEIIRLFDGARVACTALRFAEGLAIYEAIPIGQIRNHSLH